MPKQKSVNKLERLVGQARGGHAKMLTRVQKAQDRVVRLGQLLQQLEDTIARAQGTAGASSSPPAKRAGRGAGAVSRSGRAKAVGTQRGDSKRATSKRTSATRAPARAAAPKRAAVKRTPAKRTTAKRTPAKRTTATRTTAKRTPAKRTTAKRTTASRRTRTPGGGGGAAAT